VLVPQTISATGKFNTEPENAESQADSRKERQGSLPFPDASETL